MIIRKDTILFLKMRVFFLKRYYIILEFESLFSEKILYYS